MIRLTNFRFYTCGHIENDYGNDWRGSITNALKGVEPSFRIWDPLIKPAWMPEDTKNDSLNFDKGVFYSNKAATEIRQRIYNSTLNCRRVCKYLAGQCDIIIARLAEKFTWGSIDELEIGINRGIPIFIWYPGQPVGLYGAPAFISKLEFIPEYIHYSQDSLVQKIKDIHTGKCDLPERDPERWLSLSYPGR